ncbi:MAG: DUF1080 domain-containing protein [Pirellulaceae bacterium]
MTQAIGQGLGTTRRRFLGAGLATCAAATAQPLMSRLYAAPAKEGWVELFDGKTLKGWHKNPKKIGHGTGGSWAVEQGTITGEQDPPGSGNGGILLTDRKFSDFELSIDMKPDWGVCSGLFIRGNDLGQCIQMMVDYHDAGNVGQLYGEGTRGFNTRTFDINGKYDSQKQLTGITTAKHQTADSVGLDYSCTPQAWVKAWKIDGWNTARVLVQGEHPRIVTWINGLKVCEFDGSSAKTERYDKNFVRQTLGKSGSIPVQVHGGTGWPKGSKCRWKNIRIRSL